MENKSYHGSCLVICYNEVYTIDSIAFFLPNKYRYARNVLPLTSKNLMSFDEIDDGSVPYFKNTTSKDNQELWVRKFLLSSPFFIGKDLIALVYPFLAIRKPEKTSGMSAGSIRVVVSRFLLRPRRSLPCPIRINLEKTKRSFPDP